MLSKKTEKSMHSFYNPRTDNTTQDFENLIAALKLHDKDFIIDSLNANPEIATKKTKEHKTIPMLAAEYGCAEDLFSFILSKTKHVLEEKTPKGDSLASILELHKRKGLAVVLENFQNTINSTKFNYGK